MEALNGRAIRGGWQHKFQVGLIAFLLLITLLAPAFVAGGELWPVFGSLLLFLGLLTLLNAPFDWASIGLTRLLLRRGLEKEGWWPVWLGLLDALLAAPVIVLLTLTCALGIQAFDTMAWFGGGPNARILPLETLFDGIHANPTAPEYWWVYVMLVSTMIPSLVNLTIGTTSMLRGITPIRRWLLARMPATAAPSHTDRALMTTVLSLQVFLAVPIGVLAQGVLLWVVLGVLLPAFGWELLTLAEWAASLDLPRRLLMTLGFVLPA